VVLEPHHPALPASTGETDGVYGVVRIVRDLFPMAGVGRECGSTAARHRALRHMEGSLMSRPFGMRRIAITLAAVVGVLAVMGTTASAVAFSQAGTPTGRQLFVGESAPWTAATVAAWGNVPTAAVNVTVPAGTTRFVDARFTAESVCTGDPGAWCSVRVVVANSAGTPVELSPVVSTDYKFDTPGGAGAAHSLERFSAPLGAGTYTVRVQALRMSGIRQFTLDDYSFAVSLFDPSVVNP
jgi:hypothetical protein